MSSFGRALRLSFRYRSTLVASMVCALLVGVLWGGNIATVYPFVEIAFNNESLQHWVVRKIDQSQKTLAEKQNEAASLRQKLVQAADAEKRPLQVNLRLCETRIEAEQKAITRFRRVQPYIDRYLPHSPFQTLVVLVGFLMVGTVVKDAFLIANTILVARLAQLSTMDLRKLFYRRTLQLDLASFSSEGTSDLMSRFTNDMTCLTHGINTLFGRLIREPLKAIACLAVAGWVCWRLLLLSLVIAPIAAMLIQWLAKLIKRANRRAMEKMAILYNTLEETFRGIKTVKAFTMERQERWRFHQNSKQYYGYSMQIAKYDALARPLHESLGIATICLALLAGAYLVLSGGTHLLGIRMCNRPLDMAELLTFYGSLAGVADPMRKLSDVFAMLQAALAAADRIYERLDRLPQVCDPQQPRPFARHRRDLVFDNVGFAYHSGRPILKGINLRIPFGETVALVGPNGCGKTTLANLIPRFCDPGSGEIRLDGIRLRDVRLRDLRSQVGLVAQETLLFNDTVYNNIRYGSSQATRAEVIAAARQAHAHRFIESDLPSGYETIVGPSGSCLSGGQRQRIALARAILRNPAILILDEATSQVDLESEQLIQKVLEQFVRGRTAVIITHQMGVLSLADRIIVMEDGCILDVGTHDELIGRCELYHRLYRIQFDDMRESA